jgi:hypothetical protein
VAHIGRLLVDAAEAKFRALGGSRADAMVLDDNALAHHAWRSGGYAPEPEWSRWVKPL